MNTPSTDRHQRLAAETGPVSIAVVTVSDSRDPDTDTNGIYLRQQIDEAGHALAGYRIIPDEPALISQALDEFAPAARIIIFNGGTGISRRDSTYDVLSRTLEKELPGFGELFRMLSFAQVGSAAMLTRATAGLYQGAVVISTPGSPAAVRLAWEELIAPEVRHLAWEVGR